MCFIKASFLLTIKVTYTLYTHTYTRDFNHLCYFLPSFIPLHNTLAHVFINNSSELLESTLSVKLAVWVSMWIGVPNKVDGEIK